MKAHNTLILTLFLTVMSVSGVCAQSPSLEQKVKSVLPSPDEERWLQIGWHTDLMKARREAQRLGKPLFLWIMDGHPLACV